MEKVISPLLSVVVPVYNVEEYLPRCIDSILSQPFINFELILVDDGSPDKCGEICDEYAKKDNRVVVIHQKNSGVSAARNSGLDVARGKYIWFIDSDDYISSKCIKKIINAIEEYNLDAFCIKNTGELFFYEDLSDNSLELSPIISGEQFILENKPITVAPWGYIFNLSFWRNNKFSFIPNIFYEDAQLIPIVVSKCERIATFKEPITCYYYNARDGSTTHSSINLQKIRRHATIVETHLRYSRNLKSKELKKYFEISASYSFIEGVNMMYYYNRGESIIDDFLKNIIIRPKKIFASSFMRYLYQYIVLNHPIFYCRLRSILCTRNKKDILK